MGKALSRSALFLILSLVLPVAMSYIFTEKTFSNSAHFNDVYVNNLVGDDVIYDGSSPVVVSPAVGPKKTLHGGRDAVNSGGTVHVAAGIYNENICFGDNLTLLGAGALSTVISPYPGDDYEPLLAVATGNPLVHNACTISGFTIQNGSYHGTIYSGNGGGVYVGETSALTLNDCAIENNGADCGAGIYNLGTLYMNRCCVSGNSAQYQGGGIFNSSSGLVYLANCTLSGNRTLEVDGSSGGAIYNEGAMTILNCTIAGNSVPGVSMSVGGGFADYSTQPVTFKNTIIASNHAGNDIYNNGWADANDGRIIPTSLGNNIDSENSCYFNQSTDKINTDPLLGPLQNNGGSTSTHTITTASPAFNRGTGVGAPTNDQRGVLRPQAGGYDIGAFELQIASPTVTSVNPAQGTQGQSLTVLITGTNLTGTTAVSFGTGITVTGFTVKSSTQITATIHVSPAAAAAPRDVSVTKPGATGALVNGFNVLSSELLNDEGSHSSTATSSFSQSPAVVNPTFIIQGASLSGSPTSGEPVTVLASVTNTSTVNGVTKVRLYINGQVDSEQVVAVSPGRQMPVSFTVSRSEPGAYQVYVNGTPAGTFTVSDNSAILYVSIACLFLAFVLGVILIYRKLTI